MEKCNEYVVLSHKKLSDIMGIANKLDPTMSYRETQGEMAWIKRFGLYMKPMKCVSIFPTNETMERERRLPNRFGVTVRDSGVMCIDLYRIIDAYMSSPHTFGCVFEACEHHIMAKVDMSHDIYHNDAKIKRPVKEIISYCRILSVEEFGAMEALREI